MASRTTNPSVKKSVITKSVEGELLVYDALTDKAYCLNETSALVWQACDGNKNCFEISKQLSAALNQPVDEELVALAIDQLRKENLLSHDYQNETKFIGSSRREVIKKIGLGSMIALPIVSSMIIPPASSAASCPNGFPPTIQCGCPCNLGHSNCVGCQGVCDTTIGLCV